VIPSLFDGSQFICMTNVIHCVQYNNLQWCTVEECTVYNNLRWCTVEGCTVYRYPMVVYSVDNGVINF